MRDRYDYSFGQGGGTFYITSYEEYLDGIIYKDGNPKCVLTETGYLSLEDNMYRFYIKDYLGSIRLVKNGAGAVEEINNYYPSGALFTVPVPDVQNYKYSGKERVDYANLGWYDYGALYYDSVLMRWEACPEIEAVARTKCMNSEFGPE